MARRRMARRELAGLIAGAALVFMARPILAEEAISPEARSAVNAIGQTLAKGGFSFEAKTVRQYFQKDDLPLHIFHVAEVTVRRPDRLLVQMDGDDGKALIGYDGGTLTVYSVAAKKYGTMPITGSLETMLRAASDRMDVDFPLADLLADEPGKAFLDGIIAGKKVGETTIDGKPVNHFFFVQPMGIELELWAEATEQALPRRIIITYRSIPGEPQFVAELSNWKLGLTPDDATFIVKPPADAVKVEIKERSS